VVSNIKLVLSKTVREQGAEDSVWA